MDKKIIEAFGKALRNHASVGGVEICDDVNPPYYVDVCELSGLDIQEIKEWLFDEPHIYRNVENYTLALSVDGDELQLGLWEVVC
jgi:hypothetical protein